MRPLFFSIVPTGLGIFLIAGFSCPRFHLGLFSVVPPGLGLFHFLFRFPKTASCGNSGTGSRGFMWHSPLGCVSTCLSHEFPHSRGRFVAVRYGCISLFRRRRVVHAKEDANGVPQPSPRLPRGARLPWVRAPADSTLKRLRKNDARFRNTPWGCGKSETPNPRSPRWVNHGLKSGIALASFAICGAGVPPAEVEGNEDANGVPHQSPRLPSGARLPWVPDANRPNPKRGCGIP